MDVNFFVLNDAVQYSLYMTVVDLLNLKLILGNGFFFTLKRILQQSGNGTGIMITGRTPV